MEPTSWKPEFFVDGLWSGNALRFATKEEAEKSGRELLSRWFVPSDSRAAESSDPVNYKFTNGENERLND
jgi:hypothetical protein